LVIIIILGIHIPDIIKIAAILKHIIIMYFLFRQHSRLQRMTSCSIIY
jgi:hypothetical protein